MAGIQDLIEVYRGENLLDTLKNKIVNPLEKWNALSKAKEGRFVTTALNYAKDYAKKFPNVIKSAKITPRAIKIGEKLFNKAHFLQQDYGSVVGTDWYKKNYGTLQIASKPTVEKLKVNVLETLISNAKSLTPLAIKGLQLLASLPAQAVLMTLSPTKMGDGELRSEDLEKLNIDETNYKLEQLIKDKEDTEKEGTEKEEMAQGGVASMFRKKQADGTDPNYEGWKKIYETNPDLAALNDKHDEYLEKYTLEMSTSDASEAGILGTEEANMEFVETDDGEEVMVDDRINLMAAAPEKQPFLSSDQSATTLFMSEGGRIGLQGGGGQIGGTADMSGGKTGGGFSDKDDNRQNYTSKTTTAPSTKTDNTPDARDDYKTKQYTTGPKTRTKTIDSPKLNKITGKKVPTYTIQTPFSPKTKKNTWHETAVKNINRNIKDVDRTLNPSPFSLLDVVLTIGSLGLINPAVTKVAKTISNVRTGLKVSNIVSDPTKTKSVKDVVKDVLTSTAKTAISKKTGIDVKTIDTTLDTIQKALNTDLGKSVVDKFNSLNTTNKNTTKTTTFDGGNNDGPDKAITPVVPELIAEDVIIEEPTSSLSNMATLDLLRNRQNRRRSFFNANSGGLAGLFKVKKQ